jgi:hypothetical protein
MKAKILLWLMSLPCTKGDLIETVEHRTERMAVLAEAVATVAKSDRQRASFILTQLDSESNFDLAVAECECSRFQCDPLRHSDGTWEAQAHGLVQGHLVPSQPDAYSNWWGLCGVTEKAAMANVRFVSRRYNASNLAAAFASFGGILARPTDKWVQVRVAKTLKLAVRL